MGVILAGPGGNALAAAAAGTIQTVAGGTAPGPSPALDTALDPAGVTIAGGTTYVADTAASVVRMISAGNQTVVAGNGVSGYSGDGGAAVRASLSSPQGMALDASGNLIIADSNNNRLRVVARSSGTSYGIAMTAGHIYTLAGSGTCAYSGDGGPPVAAALCLPNGVMVDASGNVVIADSGNSVIRVVAAHKGKFYDVPMNAGDIYTVAGNGNCGYSGDDKRAIRATLCSPLGLAVDGSGNLLVSDSVNNAVRILAVSTGTFYGRHMTSGDIYTLAGDGTPGYSGDGGSAVSSQLSYPYGLATDGSGNVIVADSGNYRLRVVASASGNFYGEPMTAGDIYTIAGSGNPGLSADGTQAPQADLNTPYGVAVDPVSGTVVFADYWNFRLRSVAADTAGIFRVHTVAGNGTSSYSGDGGPATNAQLFSPQGVAVNPLNGNMVIADYANSRIRSVDPAGNISTFAGTGVPGYSGDGGQATAAQLAYPTSVAVDGSGNVIIADPWNHVVRVVAGGPGTFYGIGMAAGLVYTVAGNGGAGDSGDGGPGTAAELQFPQGVSVDGHGNLLIADSGASRIRALSPTGIISTLAGDGTAGGSGDGGPATSAQLNGPRDVTVDGAGNLVIADTANQRIRVVAASITSSYGIDMQTGNIYTVAGTGAVGYAPDGTAATSATFSDPTGITVDGAGNLIISDMNNSAVRAVAKSTTSAYGVTMTAGHIYTVAGNGACGYSGDSAAATSAQLCYPTATALTGSGDLLVADSGNNRVREVTHG